MGKSGLLEFRKDLRTQMTKMITFGTLDFGGPGSRTPKNSTFRIYNFWQVTKCHFGVCPQSFRP